MSELTLAEQIMETVASCRRFLSTAALGLAVPAALAACNEGDASGRTPPSKPTNDHDNAGHASGAAAGTSAKNSADEMDRMHEAGVKAFPAKTEGRGNQLLKPRLVKGVKVFELTCKKVQWEVEV